MTFYCEFLSSLVRLSSSRSSSAVQLHTLKPTYQINVKEDYLAGLIFYNSTTQATNRMCACDVIKFSNSKL